MNLQQLEYIIAIDHCRHFVTAAEKSNVTQATLSMMIKKLEEELNIKIFDRSKKPVVPTEIGEKIIKQAKLIIHEANKLSEIVNDEKSEVSGELKIGIIPTLSPYLLPVFINTFLKKFPKIHLKISELATDEIVLKLEQQKLDAGILATPLHKPSIKEHPLFYEEFVVYASPKEKLLKKKYILAADIDINKLWLLEEGHCLRSQVINLCELKNQERAFHQLDFEAGSIETIIRLVESNQGITILPSMALLGMSTKQKKNIRHFKKPAPVREISIITYHHFSKERLISALKNEILLHIPEELKHQKKNEVIGIK